MARKKLWSENLNLTLPAGAKARMDATLRDGEDRLDLIRQAIDREIEQRTSAPTSLPTIKNRDFVWTQEHENLFIEALGYQRIHFPPDMVFTRSLEGLRCIAKESYRAGRLAPLSLAKRIEALIEPISRL